MILLPGAVDFGVLGHVVLLPCVVDFWVLGHDVVVLVPWVVDSGVLGHVFLVPGVVELEALRRTVLGLGVLGGMTGSDLVSVSSSQTKEPIDYPYNSHSPPLRAPA